MKPDHKKLRCAKCNFPLYAEQMDGNSTVCIYCGNQLIAFAFPALFRPKALTNSRQDEQTAYIASEEEAGCYYHPRRQANTVCASCGRFICELCNVRLNDDNMCSLCLEISLQQKSTSLETRRILYDNLALLMAFLPIFLVLPTLITAPTAIYLCIRYWRKPLSITPRTKIRFILAFILASTQIGLWITFFYNFFL